MDAEKDLSKKCPKCGKFVRKSRNKNYSYECNFCDEERSMISPDYARNFICDFILGKEQKGSQLQLF